MDENRNSAGDSVFKVNCLAEAVRLLQQYHDLDERAVVERYPSGRNVRSGEMQLASVHYYQFFDKQGLNVGMCGGSEVVSFAKGREYANWQEKEICKIDVWFLPVLSPGFA